MPRWRKKFTKKCRRRRNVNFRGLSKNIETEIDSEVRKNIKIYDKDIDIHLFQPLSHNCEQVCNNSCTHKCYKTLGSIMRKILFFIVMERAKLLIIIIMECFQI